MRHHPLMLMHPALTSELLKHLRYGSVQLRYGRYKSIVERHSECEDSDQSEYGERRKETN